MADRADWDAVVHARRQQAVDADAELRRRHPDQEYPPLRSAAPEQVAQAPDDKLALAAGETASEAVEGMKDLAARRAVTGQITDPHSWVTASGDPDYPVFGQAAWPSPWPSSAQDIALRAPEPEIRSTRVAFGQAAGRDAELEAGE